MHSRREFLKTSSLALGFVGCMGFVGRALALPRKILPVWDGVTKVSAVTCYGGQLACAFASAP